VRQSDCIQPAELNTKGYNIIKVVTIKVYAPHLIVLGQLNFSWYNKITAKGAY